MLFVLNEKNSIANDFLMQLRDEKIQQDRMRFKKNLERIGEIMAYEISQHLSYEKRTIRTPLDLYELNVIKTQPVLLTILRAGLPFFQGFANFFDGADCGFIGAYRLEEEGKVDIQLDYVAAGNLEGKPVILIDPMLATGHSIINSINQLIKKGKPSHLFIVSLVAAPEGIDHLKKSVSLPYSLWTCAIDKRLNENFYIVPGLGDAGDLSFGVKI